MHRRGARSSSGWRWNRRSQFVSSFDRPNIRYRVTQKNNARKQLQTFLETEHPDDAGIVYCLSRKKVEETAAWLKEQGWDALPYHAGLDAATRSSNQSRFLREEGVIMVATVAFGMGIDKPNVRFVAHLDLPKSMEGYYQETGRAGRDGLPANAWMAYGLGDVVSMRQMLLSGDAPEERKRVELQKARCAARLLRIHRLPPPDRAALFRRRASRRLRRSATTAWLPSIPGMPRKPRRWRCPASIAPGSASASRI